MKRQHRRCGGWTMVELLAVLALMVVLQTTAVPALSAALDARRLSAVTHSLYFSLQLSRSEAIKRGGRVVLCKSADGLACNRTGSWAQGWIVFHDVNNNAQVDADEAILQREQALSGSVRLSGNTPVESYVSYTALGHTSTTGGGLQVGTLTVCQPAATKKPTGLQIVISSTGRARTQRVTLNQCV